jgi:hypothetical protein
MEMGGSRARKKGWWTTTGRRFPHTKECGCNQHDCCFQDQHNGRFDLQWFVTTLSTQTGTRPRHDVWTVSIILGTWWCSPNKKGPKGQWQVAGSKPLLWTTGQTGRVNIRWTLTRSEMNMIPLLGVAVVPNRWCSSCWPPPYDVFSKFLFPKISSLLPKILIHCLDIQLHPLSLRLEESGHHQYDHVPPWIPMFDGFNIF